MNTEVNDMFFRAPGKLLITGEYVVLHGAEAFSLPVRFGQSLSVRPVSGSPALIWNTMVDNKLWFEATLSIPDFVIGNTTDFPTAQALRTLLLNARFFNPGFLLKAERLEANSEVDYDISWGLGSSSSLTVNIARWAGIDPFQLHFRTYTGSGYDVASAYSGRPLIYSLKEKAPEYMEINFDPPFKDHLWFVYLGKKKSSSEAIAKFEKSRKKNMGDEIERISYITREIVKSTDIVKFTGLLQEHDRIISGLVGSIPLTEKMFRDFNGYAKYLGAWGGDFAMLVSSSSNEYVSSWLKKKDFKIWFPSHEIITL